MGRNGETTVIVKALKFLYPAKFVHLISIAVLVFASLQLAFQPAQAQESPVERRSNSGAPYSQKELLIKFKDEKKVKKSAEKPETVGIQSVDEIMRKNNAKSVDKLIKKSSKKEHSKQIDKWYVASFDSAEVETLMKIEDRVINPNLENAKAQLEKDPNIESVEFNYIVETQLAPNDPYYSSTGSWGQSYQDLWGLHRVNAANAWDVSTGSSSVIVANVDTGLDLSHPDIDPASLWTNPAEIGGNGIDDDANGYIDDVHGWNWVGNNGNVSDDNGHGTHTAGTILSRTNNSTGVAGMAWSAQMMTLRFLNSTGNGVISDGAEAIVYAADMGADITSNSWGCSCYSQALDDAVAYAHSLNLVTVVAAGNNYAADALTRSPASSDGAITVGATDHANALAGFSNVGERIDVVAPGVDILSLKSAQSPVCPANVTVGTQYCRLSGTSMATPHVTGTVILMLADDPSLTNEEVRQRLRNNTVDLGAANRDSTFGYGLINASAAVSDATDYPDAVISSPATRSLLTTNNVNVVGTANSSNFASYKVEIGESRNSSTQFSQIASSTTPVVGGVLATFDPTTYNDNFYTLRVTVTDTNGKTSVYEIHDIEVDFVEAEIVSPLDLISNGTIDIIGTTGGKNGQSFSRYAIDYGVGSNSSSFSNAGINMTANGDLPITNGKLASWNTTSLTPGQLYTLRLTVWLDNGVTQTETLQVKVDADLVEGWPKYHGSTMCTVCEGTPAMADLDGDSDLEIIIPTADNIIEAYHKNGTPVAGWPVTVIDGDWFKWPAMVDDIDADGSVEVITVAITPDNKSRIYIHNANGQQKPSWPKPIMGAGNAHIYNYSPSIADLNGDGVKDIVVRDSQSSVNTLHAYRLDGSEIAGFPKTLAPPILGTWLAHPLTIADLDNDGSPEIAFGIYDDMYLLDNQGNLLPGWPYTPPLHNGNILTFQASPTVGDIDGDGELELFSTATPNGSLFYQLPVFGWEKDGSLLPGWPQNTGQFGASRVGWPLNSVSTTDIDGDTIDEVIVGNNNMTIHKLTGPVSGLNPMVGNGPPTIGYTTNDSDIKFSAGRYKLTNGVEIANSNTTSYWRNDNIASGSMSSPFIMADMDNNGKMEYAGIMNRFGAGYGTLTYLWEIPGNGVDPVDAWPMWGHDASHTSRFSAGVNLPPDTAPPSVSVTAPTNGSTINGVVNVAATAADADSGVAYVEFYIDGVLTASDNTGPYSLTWDTKLVPNGQHTIKATAYDQVGLSSSNTVTVTVANPDITPPTVTITAPLNGATIPVRQNYTITATASDNVALNRVEFYVNGSRKCSDTSPPYSCVFKAGTKSGTAYAIQARAFDTSGLSSTHTVNVTAQ